MDYENLDAILLNYVYLDHVFSETRAESRRVQRYLMLFVYTYTFIKSYKRFSEKEPSLYLGLKYIMYFFLTKTISIFFLWSKWQTSRRVT